MRGDRPHEYTPLPLSETATPAELRTRGPERSRCTVVAGLVLCVAGCVFALYGLAR